MLGGAVLLIAYVIGYVLARALLYQAGEPRRAIALALGTMLQMTVSVTLVRFTENVVVATIIFMAIALIAIAILWRRGPPFGPLATAAPSKIAIVVAVVALIGLPAAAIALYLPLGSPQIGDFPLASRSKAPDGQQPLVNLVAQVEAHLEKNPTDGRGWTVLAPVLSRLGRHDDAVRAWRNAIAYGGDSSERRADLGEALMAAAGGIVTGESKTEF